MSNTKIIAFQHQISDFVGIRLISTRQVSPNLWISLIDNCNLENWGFQGTSEKQKSPMQFVQSQIGEKIYVNNQILNAPDGVYTWILYQVKNATVLVSCPVQTLLEYTNRHTVINYLAYKKGIIKNQNISSNLSQKSQKSYIYYAGEFKKHGDVLEFNFQSGTYSFPNKGEIEKNPEFNKTLTNIESFWHEHFIKCLNDFGFDTSKTHYVDFEDKKNPKSTFIKYQNIPFVAENYIKLQPYLQGRWIYASTYNEINKIKKKIRLYENALMTWEGLIRIPKFKDEEKPKFEGNFTFLDKANPKQNKQKNQKQKK